MVCERLRHRDLAFKEVKKILKGQYYDTQRMEVSNKLKKAEVELKSNIAQLELIEQTDKTHLEIQRAEEYLATQNAKLKELMKKSAKLGEICQDQIICSW